MVDDAKFVKRRIRGGSIDVHPSEKALVVHYETEATIIGEDGIPMLGDRKECQKIIRVRNLNQDTDIADLARKIVENCRLLSEDQLVEIEHLLKYLLKRKDSVGKVSTKKSTSPEKLSDPGAFDSTEIDEIAQLNDIDEYLELLYEDIPEKLRASCLILQLARNPDNLEELYQNETLVGALARVLREDWKESIDLATNITYIFFCFSSFSNFHGVILHFKIGALTMTIIESELKKYETTLEEMETRKTLLAEASRGGDTTAVLEARKSYETITANFATLKRKQEQLFRVSFYLLLNISEDLNIEVKMYNRGIVSLISQCLNRDNFELLILLVSFLKKLSIFQENKDDMIKHHVIEKLGRLVARPETDLVNITVRLLLNLSFDTKAREQMVANSLIPTLVNIVETNEDSRLVALYVLYHLSIEDVTKPLFVETNCLPVLIRLALEDSSKMADIVPMALAINLACDAKCASVLAEGKGIRVLMKRALKMRDPLIMKLLRNICQHGKELKMKFVDFIPNLAEVIVSGPIASENNAKNNTADGIPKRDIQNPVDGSQRFVLMLDGANNGSANSAKENRYLHECLGCLANLSLKELDFSRILMELGLLAWIKTKLQEAGIIGEKTDELFGSKTGQLYPIEDDTTLEVVRLLGAACQDTEAARLIVNQGVVPLLVDVLNGKQEDDEIVCQIIHVFYQLVFHKATIATVVKTTDIPAYLIDLMHDKNRKIRQLCEISLNIIAEFDKIWGSRIQAERFRWHNSQWLEMIDSVHNPIKIKTDPITDAAIAAAFANGHARVRRHLLSHGDVYPEPDDNAAEMTGPFGFGREVDDATAFLMTLSANALGRKGSASSDAPVDVINTEAADFYGRLDPMYAGMYDDLNLFGYNGSSPVMSNESPSDSDDLASGSRSP